MTLAELKQLLTQILYSELFQDTMDYTLLDIYKVTVWEQPTFLKVEQTIVAGLLAHLVILGKLSAKLSRPVVSPAPASPVRDQNGSSLSLWIQCPVSASCTSCPSSSPTACPEGFRLGHPTQK